MAGRGQSPNMPETGNLRPKGRRFFFARCRLRVFIAAELLDTVTSKLTAI